MDMFSRAELDRLVAPQSGACVSIFFSTHLPGSDAEQDEIRLRKLARQAEAKLSDGWMRAPDARDLLGPARALANEPEFWNSRNKGLAIFACQDGTHRYRLPISFFDSVFVSGRFNTRPLLPLLEKQTRFYVLAVSQNDVRLYSADQLSMRTVEVAGLPANMEVALNFDGADRGAQVHSAARGAIGKQAAVFHGQGGRPDTAKSDLQTYVREIERAVSRHLRGASEPLILACVDSLLPLYQRANSYPHLLGESVSGNADYTNPSRLHEQAIPLAEAFLKREALAAATEYHRNLGTDVVSDDVEHVVPAAYQGRVRTLFYNPQASLCGIYQSADCQLHVTNEPDDDDLIDMSVVETLRRGGTIYAMNGLDLATNSPLAAMYRY